jgi:hypothetical protein
VDKRKTFWIVYKDALWESLTPKRIGFVILLFILLLLLLNAAGFLQLLAFVFWLFQPQLPMTLLVPYYALAALFPLIAMVFIIPPLAGAVENRSTHFIIVRIPRWIYAAGTFVAALTVQLLLMLIYLFIALLYTYYQLRSFYLPAFFTIGIGLAGYGIFLSSLYFFIGLLAGRVDRALQMAVLVTIAFVVFLAFSGLQPITPFWYLGMLFEATAAALFFWFGCSLALFAGTIVLFERKQL